MAPEPVSSDCASSTHSGVGGVFAGLRIVSLCTLLSRVLGLIRDVGMAATFGNGPVMDAFTVAFRLPNLARRLFGEGAWTAAFLPAFVRELERDGRESAWRLATAVFATLTVGLSVLVLLCEAALLGVVAAGITTDDAGLLLGLTAALLPYLVLICLAAQMSAVMHGLNHFAWPALLPVLLNLVWIAGLWFVVPRWSSPREQIYVVTACVVAAGIVQILAPAPALRRLGFRFAFDWRAALPRVRSIFGTMLPVLVGLSITQLNTLLDSLIAWGFAAPESGSQTMSLPGGPRFPLEPGTASALYFGQRMYQFPLGVFGVALGTVLFPLLSRNAERGRVDLVREHLTLGLRLTIIVGIPAGAGLFLLAGPLTDLLFRHGAFDAVDAVQTAQMIAAYGIGVWAYSGLLILNRAYFAVGDQRTPVLVGAVAMAINLILNFTLIWPLGGRGLAVGTAVAAMIQCALSAWLLQRRIGRLSWRSLGGTAVRTILATAVMAAACVLTEAWSAELAEGLTGRALRVAVPVVVSVAVFLLCARILGLSEIQHLWRTQPPNVN